MTGDTPISETCKGAMPFVVTFIIRDVILGAFPAITLWLVWVFDALYRRVALCLQCLSLTRSHRHDQLRMIWAHRALAERNFLGDLTAVNVRLRRGDHTARYPCGGADCGLRGSGQQLLLGGAQSVPDHLACLF